MLDFNQWRSEARILLAKEMPPAYAQFQNESGAGDLFQGMNSSANTAKTSPPSPTPRVPQDFLDRAPYVFAFRDEDTPHLLYRVLWRLSHGEPNLLKISVDPDTQEFDSRFRLVHRDIHKMKAFVRFREFEGRFIAWHRPDHKIVRFAADFFVERFNGMNWSILTSDECIHWDQKELTLTPGVSASAAPQFDSAEELWKTYYGSTFNPARIKWNAMMKEMPVRHWKTMPETAMIQELIRNAPERLQTFFREQHPTADKWIPLSTTSSELTIQDLKHAIPTCRACGICERATQPVMGVGPVQPEIALIGEQPGEEEDQAGLPFIGPAGQLLEQALKEVGLEREKLYITNAVKGFKWMGNEHHGKTEKIHRGADPSEIAACNPWLKRELSIIKPKKIVCLGRSAAQSILGKSVLMREVRGKFFKTSYSDHTLIIPHPSFILRIQDPVQQQEEYQRFVQELRLIHDTSFLRFDRNPHGA